MHSNEILIFLKYVHQLYFSTPKQTEGLQMDNSVWLTYSIILYPTHLSSGYPYPENKSKTRRNKKSSQNESQKVIVDWSQNPSSLYSLEPVADLWLAGSNGWLQSGEMWP